MSSVSVRIEYEKDLYFPGDLVKGHTILSLTKNKEIKNITLKAHGYSQVEWEDTSIGKPTICKGTEVYYEYEFRILTSGKKFDEGTHKFEFSFPLPMVVPCSFESKAGSVKHYCKVSINIVNKFFDVKGKFPFAVGGFLDLNFVAAAKKRIHFIDEKTLCCFCCTRGTLSLALAVDHSGYVPGENITVNAECNNRSRNHTEKTTVALYQEIVYYVKHKKLKVLKKICSKSHPGVRPGEDDIWSGEDLLVPALPPSGLPMCRLIDVNYILVFSFVPSGLSFRLEVDAPIIIGTNPLTNLNKGPINL